MAELATVTREGQLQLSLHPGQMKAWTSEKRIVAVIAGTQSGKTSFLPYWLFKEIQRSGPGDYLIVTPTFQLLEKKALPEFKSLFEERLGLGRYVSNPVRKFEFSEKGCRRTFPDWGGDKKTIVHFGYAEDPESLESMTAKAAALDEAGQKKFKLSSWEAIRRRLSLAMGRVFIGTTPYDLGWLKQKIYDPWLEAERDHPDIDLIRFDSTENPAFPQEEFERARRDLPKWKFDLFYRGIFTRPAGQIYDCFNDAYGGHKVRPFAIPEGWRRYLGLDFGGVNTAGVFLAEDPKTRILYLYREYHAGGRTAAEHVYHLLKGEPVIPTAVGGSHSEGQWRQEFKAGGQVAGKPVPGLTVLEPPIKDVEVGINRVYGTISRNELRVFDTCEKTLEDLVTYSREVDDNGEPTEEIADKKSFHRADALRYLIARLRSGATTAAATGGKRRFVDDYQVR